MTASSTYDVSAWVKLPADSSNATVTMTLKTIVDAAPTYSNIASQSLSAASGWVKFSGKITPPAGDLTEYKIYFESPQPTADFQVDNMVLAPEVVTPVINLIENGNFESGELYWWFDHGTVGKDITAPGYEDNHSLLVYSRGNTWAGPAIGIDQYVIAGESYSASVWVKLNGGAASTTINLTAKHDIGGDDQFINIASAVVTDTAGWVKLSGTLNAPLGEFSQYYLYIEAANVDAVYQVDNLVLSEQ